MHVDRSCFDQPVVAPDALQQPVARHDAVLVLHQIPQQLELAARQAHRRAVHRDATASKSARQVLAAIARAAGALLGAVVPRRSTARTRAVSSRRLNGLVT